MTDGSSSNRKRSASTERMDVSDNDTSLFADTDDNWDAPDDRRKNNQELMLASPKSDQYSTRPTLTP